MLWCVQNLFVKERINKEFKTALITSFILLLAFTRKNIKGFLVGMKWSCSTIIQNSAHTENNVGMAAYYLNMISTIQLKDVTFTRNIFWRKFLVIAAKSNAIIQNNILTKTMLIGQFMLFLWWVVSSWIMWHLPEIILRDGCLLWNQLVVLSCKIIHLL